MRAPPLLLVEPVSTREHCDRVHPTDNTLQDEDRRTLCLILLVTQSGSCRDGSELLFKVYLRVRSVLQVKNQYASVLSRATALKGLRTSTSEEECPCAPMKCGLRSSAATKMYLSY